MKKNNGKRNVQFLAAAALTAALMAGQIQPAAVYGSENIQVSSLIPDNVTVEQPVPLSEISLPSSEYGTLSWADESSVPSERVQSYDVVFRPYNAADLSKISGWDGSSDVIYSSVRVVVSGIEENESQEEEWSEENNGEASEDQNDSQWEEENSGTGENDSQESEDHSTGSTDEDAGESNPDGQENDGTEEDSQQNSNGDSADKGNNESSGNSQTEGSQQDGDSDSAEENNSQESEDQNAGSKDEDASDSNGNGETEEESQQDGDSNPAEGESQDNAGDKEDMPEAGEKPEPTVTPEATVTPEVSVTPEPTVTPEADKDNIFEQEDQKDQRPSDLEENLTEEEKEELAAANHTSNGISVSGINLPWYVQFRATSGEDYQFTNENEANLFKSYEFELWDLRNNTEYEIPDGEYISVTVPVKAGYTYTIEHLLDSGAMETIVPSVEGSTMVFSTHSFSPFGIAGSKPLVGGEIQEDGYGDLVPVATVTPTASTGVTAVPEKDDSSSVQKPQDDSKDSDKQTNTSEDSSKEAEENDGSSKSAVNTGDNTMIAPFIILGVVAIVVVGVIIYFRKKK
ncbi:MAG: hypothetical protein Q4B97_09465 [Lachnospiraceae bacterium]|nr:hypothetical protein [Lachnospiraceae bacterium]